MLNLLTNQSFWIYISNDQLKLYKNQTCLKSFDFKKQLDFINYLNNFLKTLKVNKIIVIINLIEELFHQEKIQAIPKSSIQAFLKTRLNQAFLRSESSLFLINHKKNMVLTREINSNLISDLIDNLTENLLRLEKLELFSTSQIHEIYHAERIFSFQNQCDIICSADDQNIVRMSIFNQGQLLYSRLMIGGTIQERFQQEFIGLLQYASSQQFLSDQHSVFVFLNQQIKDQLLEANQWDSLEQLSESLIFKISKFPDEKIYLNWSKLNKTSFLSKILSIKVKEYNKNTFIKKITKVTFVFMIILTIFVEFFVRVFEEDRNSSYENQIKLTQKVNQLSHQENQLSFKTNIIKQLNQEVMRTESKITDLHNDLITKISLALSEIKTPIRLTQLIWNNKNFPKYEYIEMTFVLEKNAKNGSLSEQIRLIHLIHNQLVKLLKSAKIHCKLEELPAQLNTVNQITVFDQKQQSQLDTSKFAQFKLVFFYESAISK